MRQLVIPTNKKGRASRAPAKTINHPQTYESCRQMSRVFSKRSLRRDRTPPQAPSRPAASTNAAGLPLLLARLALQADGLRPKQRAAAREHARHWAVEIVESKRGLRRAT